jgi:hypothetical protein
MEIVIIVVACIAFTAMFFAPYLKNHEACQPAVERQYREDYDPMEPHVVLVMVDGKVEHVIGPVADGAQAHRSCDDVLRYLKDVSTERLIARIEPVLSPDEFRDMHRIKVVTPESECGHCKDGGCWVCDY